MSEKNIKPGRYLSEEKEAPTTAQSESGAKVTGPTRDLVGQLAGCLAVVGGIVLTHATGDITTRLALILSAAVLADVAFNIGVWSQRRAIKGGEHNG